MDWAMLGAIGELLGAAGVIFSLLYLARQIKESSRGEQRTRYEASLQGATRCQSVSGGPKLHRSGGRKCHTWRSSSSGCEAPSVSSVS